MILVKTLGKTIKPKQRVADQGEVLTPGRYVGAAPKEEDDEPFDEKGYD
jgi:hypothetical protein